MKFEQKVINAATVFLLLLGVFLPLLDSMFGLDKTRLTENRALAQKPMWAWKSSAIQTYPASFGQWYNDHFGFRNSLIGALSRFRVKALNVSSNDNVV
ncbi:MAG: hypothetical protein VCD00_00965, partial [Candidatus Hydrogenedentota bacterium]